MGGEDCGGATDISKFDDETKTERLIRPDKDAVIRGGTNLIL